MFCSMEELRNRYMLLQDCIGETLKGSVPTLGIPTKSTPRQVLKGELLEALPESEQPGDSTRIAFGGIDRKLRLECRMEDVKKLTPEEADLLLGISSTKSRCEIYFDGKRLDFGKRLEHGSHVLVSIQGVSEKLAGVVRFKGGLPNLPGTMFGVELHVHVSLMSIWCKLSTVVYVSVENKYQYCQALKSSNIEV